MDPLIRMGAALNLYTEEDLRLRLPKQDYRCWLTRDTILSI